MRWCASAPANIALIKYMGKEDARTNSPINTSLSYTLPSLITKVALEKSTDPVDRWEPLHIEKFKAPALSTAATARFLKHLTFLKQQFNYQGTFIVRSANNFPQGTGLASSASSFSALTQCAAIALAELTQSTLPSTNTQSAWSRQGSGSSCRSFYQPWAIWEKDTTHTIDLPYTHLEHQVILIHTAEKEVSSSEAHQRIQSSPLYATRKARAEIHFQTLLKALYEQQWHDAYQICWKEFQDMHELFHTATPSFRYITKEATFVLDMLQAQWNAYQDGPLITMDAGPNIHLLYRPDQTALKLAQKALLSEHYHVL